MNENIEFNIESRQANFARKLLFITFVILVLSLFLNVLNIMAKKNIDFFLPNRAILSLVFPIIIGLIILYVARIYSQQFERRSVILAFLISTVLFIIALSIYIEIVPILNDVKPDQSFSDLFVDRAILYPGAIIVLSILYPWFHESLSRNTYFLRYVFFLLSGIFYLEFIIINLKTSLGIAKVLLLSIALMVILSIIRLKTDHEVSYREKLRGMRLLR